MVIGANGPVVGVSSATSIDLTTFEVCEKVLEWVGSVIASGPVSVTVSLSASQYIGSVLVDAGSTDG